MDPIVLLAIATAVFLATHFVTSTPLRPALVRAMGEWPYRGLYSLVAFVTLGWMIWATARRRASRSGRDGATYRSWSCPLSSFCSPAATGEIRPW
jgi:hypothetical protein